MGKVRYIGKFTFEDNEYIITRGKIHDKMFCEIENTLAERIKRERFLNYDYAKLNEQEMIDFVNMAKSIQLFEFVKGVIENIYQKYSGNLRLVRYTLPIYSSCCRELNLSSEAIHFSKQFINEETFSGQLYTSLSSAACDIGLYSEAKNYLEMAQKFKNTDPATNDLIINNVKSRIESCINMPPYMRKYKIQK